MALFDFTAEDVARGTVLQPGWYPIEVKKVEDGIAKSTGKPKVTISFVCLEGTASDGSLVQNVPLASTFSPEYPSFIINFAKACGAEIPKQGLKGLRIDDETLKGKKLSGYVKNQEYEGRTVNNLADYRPLE